MPLRFLVLVAVCFQVCSCVKVGPGVAQDCETVCWVRSCREACFGVYVCSFIIVYPQFGFYLDVDDAVLRGVGSRVV